MLDDTKIILVLGIHRSGSSAVAGILNRGGIHTGDRMIGPAPSNPKGHFENRDFVMLNEWMIGPWQNPQPAPTDEQLDEYAGLLAGLGNYPISAIKDPRFCFTAKYLVPMIDWLSLIVVQRDLAAASHSLAKRERMPFDWALEIQRYYLVARDQFLISQNIPMFARFDVSYDALVDDPDEVVPALLEFAYAGTDIEPTDDQVQRAIDFIDPELRHHGTAQRKLAQV